MRLRANIQSLGRDVVSVEDDGIIDDVYEFKSPVTKSEGGNITINPQLTQFQNDPTWADFVIRAVSREKILPEGFTLTKSVPSHVLPKTPIPTTVSISDAVIAAGDAQRGLATYSRSACIGCHKIRGNPSSLGVIGPDLTHMASRYTIGSGLFVNDAKHLAHWIKNARAMKPGVLMQTLGKGEYDPIMNTKVTVGGLTDPQIADIVAYLQTLK